MAPRLLLLLALLAAPAGRDQGRFALAADAEARWVAFDLTPGNQVRFTTAVDGRPVSAILDTGAGRSVLSAGTAGGRVVPDGEAVAIGGRLATGWTPTRRVELGGLTRLGGGLAVAEWAGAATGADAPADLLVGLDLLGGAALDIDYPARRFRLLPSGRLSFTGVTAPLSAVRGVLETEAKLGARRLRPMVVDTGDGSAVTVTRAAWAAAGPAGARVTTAVSFGLAGPTMTGLAVVPGFRVGALAVGPTEVRIEPRGGFSEAAGVAGRIGTGLLGRYRVLLDAGAGRMVLRPGPLAGRPPPRSTSGLLLGVGPDRLRVLHVMRGGPAAASGWREGDLICAVDGRPVAPDYAADPDAGWTAGAPGRVVRLTDCAGTTRALTLRSFY